MRQRKRNRAKAGAASALLLMLLAGIGTAATMAAGNAPGGVAGSAPGAPAGNLLTGAGTAVSSGVSAGSPSGDAGAAAASGVSAGSPSGDAGAAVSSGVSAGSPSGYAGAVTASGAEAGAEASEADPEPGRRLGVIAHRGASGYAPENTIAAFDLAAGMGADFLELDVQMTRDGVPVVIHDATVERTTDGRGAVNELTLAQLRQLDAGSWFDSKFKGERVPTLKEVLDRYYGRIGLLIEIKSPDLHPGIEAGVAGLLAEYGGSGKPSVRPVILQSFSSASVEKLRQLLPDFPLAVLVAARSDLSAARLGHFSQFAGYINLKRSLADRETISRIHAHGMKVFVWTVRGARSAGSLRLKGADGIVTNFPDEVMCRVRLT